MEDIKMQHKIESLFTLSLFMVFALLMTWLMVSGAGVYRQISAYSELNYKDRVSTAYIVNKVRSCDSADMVSVEEREGVPVLVLTEDFGGTVCETLIYCYDGTIRELFVKKDNPLTLDAGLEIYEALGARFELSDKLLKIEVDTEQGMQTQYVALRSGE